jgi:hypothetical protein
MSFVKDELADEIDEDYLVFSAYCPDVQMTKLLH